MEQILQNIEDPSWWFTGTFFVVLGILITKLLFNWLPWIWNRVSVVKPKISRKIQRWKERRILIKIKRYRQHEIKIIWLIGRYWCLATVTIIYMGFLIISFLLSAEFTNQKKQILMLMPVVFPLYILSAMTIWEKRILLRTIKSHIKWKKRITKQIQPTSFVGG